MPFYCISTSCFNSIWAQIVLIYGISDLETEAYVWCVSLFTTHHRAWASMHAASGSRIQRSSTRLWTGLKSGLCLSPGVDLGKVLNLSGALRRMRGEAHGTLEAHWAHVYLAVEIYNRSQGISLRKEFWLCWLIGLNGSCVRLPHLLGLVPFSSPVGEPCTEYMSAGPRAQPVSH